MTATTSTEITTSPVDAGGDGRPDTASAEESRSDSRRWWRHHFAWAFIIPPALFVLLRPERFGITPNFLDPFFYTGYTINFDDILREVDDDRYFVTRWSVYQPGRPFAAVFGPYWGRLALRWVVASAILLSVWHLGRQWRWSRQTELLVGLVTLTTPMFGRAFFTDYTEWFFVSFGVILICQSLEPLATVWRSALIGSLGALLVIANPLAATIIVCPGVAYIALARRRRQHPWTQVVTGLAAFAGTFLVGYLAYRWLYGIPNVYQPTIDYAENALGVRDPLKSPRLTWMGSFTWIYIPALMLFAFAVLPPLRRVLLAHPIAVLSFLFLAVQYGYQWYEQFPRDGDGLEVSYYWALVLPALTVATAIMIGLGNWSTRSASITAAAWVAVLVVFSLVDLRMPAGWVFGGIAVACVGVVTLLALKFEVHMPIAFLTIAALIWQVGSPRYDPSEFHPFNVDAYYERVFFEAGSQGDRSLEEAIWLEDRLDELPTDVGAYFYSGGGIPAGIVGIYGPHVAGNWYQDLDNQYNQALIGLGVAGVFVTYGTDDFVSAAADRLELLNANGVVLMDTTNPRGLNLRLLVMDFSVANTGGYVFDSSFLPGTVGTTDGTRRIVPADTLEQGFVSYGPYIALNDALYETTLTYSSSLPSTESAGFFDAAASGEVLVAADLPGTDGVISEVSINFPGTSTDEFEFRVYWAGREDFSAETVKIEELAR